MVQRFWLTVTLGVCAIVACASAINTGRIVGGGETHITAVPYEVSLRRKSCSECPFEHFACGTIYSRNVIVTTVTAIRGETAKGLMIVAGTSYRTAFDGMLFPVEKVHVHENFNSLSLDFDVALLKLKVDLPLGTLNTMKAYGIAQDFPELGSLGVVAGWGKTSEIGEYTEVIRSVQIPITSKETCQEVHKYTHITENMFCAGANEGGSDACKGDSGAPFVVGNEVVGLVSWGVGCARPNTPGVYTNLVQMREWISETAANL